MGQMATRFFVFVFGIVALFSLLFLNIYRGHDLGKLGEMKKILAGPPPGDGPEAHESHAIVTTKAKDRVAAGEVVYTKKGECITCHGVSGLGDVKEKAPRLAGQHGWYIELQLSKFKSKERVNEKMDPYLEKLTEEDFKDVAAYLSQLRP